MPLFRKVLHITIRVVGKGHPDTAEAWTNLGFVYTSLGKHLAAEVRYRQALTILETYYGYYEPNFPPEWWPPRWWTGDYVPMTSPGA